MANNAVHEGFWVDYSRNPVLGATLTLKSEWGTYLVAAAAVVVQIGGVALWSILAFLVHQLRSKPGLKDEYDAQVQVLLRNSATPDGAALGLFDLGRVWNGRRPGSLKSAVGLASIPALVWAGFIVAGVLVGQIATNTYSRYDVLIEPGACGGYSTSSNSLSALRGEFNVNINVTANAAQYARSCYSSAGSLSSISCSVYTVSALKYSVALDQPCPIPDTDNEACFPSGDVGAPLTLRTKPIDSHYDLGINAPKHDRMTLQDQTTCAPLKYAFVDKFIVSESIFNNDTYFRSPKGNSTVDYYTFGNYTSFGYTFSYAPVIRLWGFPNLGYTVDAAFSYAPHNILWTPASPFNRVKGDLSLFAVAPNSITFSQPVEDPMFRTFDSIDPNVLGLARYVPRRNVYMVACSSQQNICNVRNGKCTGWNTLESPQGFRELDIKELGLNEAQNATFYRLLDTLQNSNMFLSVNGVADPLLASTKLIAPSISKPVPNGQWQKEVEGWYQTLLSRYQFLQTVFPQIPLDVLEESNLEFTPAEQISHALAKQCKHQRVASPPAYQNYSLIGLVIVAFFGLFFFPVTSFALNRYHLMLPGVSHTNHRYLSYRGEGLLQLHRMALEGAGYGGWQDDIKEIPTTTNPEERIPQLVRNSDEDAPQTVLRYPRSDEVVKETKLEDSKSNS